jgi:hypothetical protein
MCTMSCENPIDCGAGRLRVRGREMQSGSPDIITTYKGDKTAVITLPA